MARETAEHAGYRISPLAMLISIAIVISSVSMTKICVKHALGADDMAMEGTRLA